MIPQIIHYCWFGGNTLPPLALECIASWRKYLPDYKIIQWSEKTLNENNNSLADEVRTFNVNIIPYTEEAYKQKKYAFVSDYARFWILYNYGGIYFDTDVEVIKPLDDIIAKGNFMGYETDPDGSKVYVGSINPGLGLGCNNANDLYKKILDYYCHLKFEYVDGRLKTVVEHITDVLLENGLKKIPGIQSVYGITVYPSEYFCPINVTTKRLHITKNTRSIHRYMDSWSDNKVKSWKDTLRWYLPEWALILYHRIKTRTY